MDPDVLFIYRLIPRKSKCLGGELPFLILLQPVAF
jgi:hypothetical protein